MNDSSVRPECQNPDAQLLRAEKERDHVLSDKFAHVQVVKPLLTFGGDRLPVRFAIASDRLRLSHSDEWRLIVLVDFLRWLLL